MKNKLRSNYITFQFNENSLNLFTLNDTKKVINIASFIYTSFKHFF